MKNKLLKIVIQLLIASTFVYTGYAQEFVHPGLINNSDELNFIKNKVNSNQQPWASGYRKMLTQTVDRIAANSLDMPRLSNLNYKPDPSSCEDFVSSTDDYKTNPCINRMKDDMTAVYCHALQWYIRGDTAHAKKAVEILNSWSYAIKSWTGERKRYAGYLITTGLYGAEIIRYSYKGWSQSDIKKFESLLNDIIWPFIKNGHPETMNAHSSNQESSVVMGKIAIAIFLNDREKFSDAVAHYRRHLKNNIYPDGKNFEVCRDLGHTELSLAHLVSSCEMAWKQGVDLYKEKGTSTSDNILLRSIEYNIPWLLNETNKPEPDCKNDPVHANNDAVDVRISAPYYEMAYNHYHNRKGVSAEPLKRMLETYKSGSGEPSRPERYSAVGFGWGTLTHYNLPHYPAGYKQKNSFNKTAVKAGGKTVIGSAISIIGTQSPSVIISNNRLHVPLKDDTNIKIEGPHRFLKIAGLTGFQPTSLKTIAIIKTTAHQGPRGSVSFWFSPLQDLDFFKMNENTLPGGNIFSLLSDTFPSLKPDDMSFGIFWSNSYPQFMGKFAKGAIWKKLDHGLAPFVYAERLPLRRNALYYMVLTWDKPAQNLKLYINGVLMGFYNYANNFEMSGEDLYIGNTMMIMRDLTIEESIPAQKAILAAYHSQKLLHNIQADNDIREATVVVQKPAFNVMRDASWKEAYTCSFTNADDLKGWIFQTGDKFKEKFDVRITKEGLLIKTPAEVDVDTRMYLWSPKTFEGDQWIEFDFRLESPQGLALLAVFASGAHREDFIGDHG